MRKRSGAYFSVVVLALLLQQVRIPGPGGKAPSAATNTFAHTALTCSAAVASGTSVNCNLGTKPSTGNFVAVTVVMGDTANTLTSVADLAGTPNVYTLPTPHCNTTNASSGAVCIAYFLNASATADNVVQANFGSACTANCIIWVDVFTSTPGPSVFDGSITGQGTGTAINSPTVTPTGSSDLLYGAAAVDHTITSANSPWTGVGGAVSHGNWAEYVVNRGSATAINFTQNSSGNWNGIGMAIK